MLEEARGLFPMQAPPPPCQRVQVPGREPAFCCLLQLVLLLASSLSQTVLVLLCLFAVEGYSASTAVTWVWWRKDPAPELDYQMVAVQQQVC